MIRRVVLAIAVLGATSCGAVGENREPWCRAVPATQLAARSVPSAALVPCVRELPQGWTFDGFAASDTGTTFSLVGPEDVAARADVAFSARCADDGGETLRSDESGVELKEEVRRSDPYAARWTYRFDGGCARVLVALGAGADPEAGRRELADAISFVERSELPAVDP